MIPRLGTALFLGMAAACSTPRSIPANTTDAGSTPVDSGPIPDAGQLSISSIAPNHGQAGSVFTIDAMGIAPQAQVFFGSVPATGVTVTPDGVQASGTIPAQESGDAGPTTVSVTVQNAPGVSATLTDGFTYASGALVDWCQTETPTSVSLTLGATSPTLSAQVYQPNVTPGTVGQAPGVTGQVGYGPPNQDVTTWTWANASYTANTGNNDVFTGTLTPAAAGTFAFAFRFSLDNGNSFVYCDTSGNMPSFMESAAGSLTVVPVGVVEVTGLSPGVMPIGGGTLLIDGAGFDSTATVSIGGMNAAVTSQTSGALTVSAPASPAPGPQSVVVTQGTTTATAPTPLEYVLKFTITVDGNLSDWPSAALVATENPANTSWMGNTLSELYLGYDDTNFYIGIQGSAQAQNATIGYLNISGVTWGSSDIATTLNEHNETGSNADLDDELSSPFNLADPTFLVHYGYGMFGTAPNLSNGVGPGTGVRQLMNATNFGWSTSTVASTSTALEIAIPWQTNGMGADLFVPFPTGAANPMTIRTFVRIDACDGTCFPTQGLPDDPNLQMTVTNPTTLATVSKVASIEIR